MKRPAAFFPIVLAFGAIIMAHPATAQDTREGPFEIEKCQTISMPGSYRLVNNLTLTSQNRICLLIAANFVTIDLAGFTMQGQAFGTAAIEAGGETTGIAVRNGSISGFGFGVDLEGSGSIVEGLRVVGGEGTFLGIRATGIVRGNTVSDILGAPSDGLGIIATGIVTGNYATNNRIIGIEVGQGSTVVGNTATQTPGDGEAGISVSCPSNVTDNTAVNNSGRGGNLMLNGTGCNNTNNVAP